MGVNRHSPGCSCCYTPCVSTTTRTVQVKGCPAAPAGIVMAGVTVNFTAPGDSRSGVTDSSGNVTFSGLGALTYTRTAVAPDARFVDTSASAAVTCGTTATLPIALTIASGYICGAGGTPCSPRPVRTTLFLTDPVLGVVTLTSSGGNWGGSLTVARPSVRTTGCGSPATRNVFIQYDLQATTPAGSPSKNTQWQLTIFLDFCLSGGVKFLIVDTGSPTGSDQVQATTTSGGCPETGAVTVPVSFAGQPVNTFQSIWGSGTQNFTFSE